MHVFLLNWKLLIVLILSFKPKDTVPAPTDVAQELAASFAPTANANEHFLFITLSLMLIQLLYGWAVIYRFLRKGSKISENLAVFGGLFEAP